MSLFMKKLFNKISLWEIKMSKSSILMAYIYFASVTALAGFPSIDKSLPMLSAANLGVESEQSFAVLDWNKWIARPGVKLLLPSDNFNAKDEPVIYHSRSIFVVNRPVSILTKEKFYNINFFSSVNPSLVKEVSYNLQGVMSKPEKQELGSNHWLSDVGINGKCANFCVKTQINFHPSWQSAIWLAKKLSALKEESKGYLEVLSETVYHPVSELNNNTKQNLSALVSRDLQPAFILQQSGFKVNQMVQFTGTLVTAYDWSGKTIIVFDTALGIKRDIDKKVRENFLASNTIKRIFGKDPDNIVANVLLGKEPGVNVADGIGRGLPSYTSDLSANLKKYLETVK